ncbi:MAG: hypothetical protein ABSB29_02750 [Nitrososphaerales archaeon]
MTQEEVGSQAKGGWRAELRKNLTPWRIIWYVVLTLVLLYGSVKDALANILQYVTGVSIPIPSFGGASLDVIVSIIGAVGLFYLVLHDTGNLHILIRPSDRLRFGTLALAEIASIILVVNGLYAISTSVGPQDTSKSFLVTGGLMLGFFGVIFLTPDLVGSLRGKQKPWGKIEGIIQEFWNPSPTRTVAMTNFISQLYEFHSSWVNIWEPAVRLRSVQPSHAFDLSDLMGKLIKTRARLRAEGSFIPSAYASDIDQFLKAGGELSAYFPTMIDVSKHGKVQPLDDDIIKTIADRGNSLSKTAFETIIPNLERTFVIRRDVRL